MAKINSTVCHDRGKTTNLTVNQLLESVFKVNEKSDRVTKFTDKAISDYVQAEFDNKTVVTPKEVAVRRRHYNYGMVFWVRRGVAERPEVGITGDRPFSYQYNEKGERIQPGSEPTPKERTQVASLDVDALRQIVQEELEGRIATMGLPDVEAVKGWVAAELAKERPTIHIEISERQIKTTLPGNKVHKSFAKVMMKVKAGVPIMLVGPAGSGKTYLASQVAEAMGLPFTFNSMSEGVSESALLGRTLPDDKGNWTYKPAPFVTSYVDGGVHLLDEIDAADPNLLVQINAAIANGKLSIPFKDDHTPFARHKNNIIIAAANTFGNGANRQYVGRNQLDAATINRFVMGTVEVDYDQELEGAIAKAILSATPEHVVILLNWAWAVRGQINKTGLRRLLSTRNIEDCAKLLHAGDDMAAVKATYFAGWTADEKRQVGA